MDLPYNDAFRECLMGVNFDFRVCTERFWACFIPFISEVI